MMMVRRQMMECLELYPIGTDIIGKYVGRDAIGKANVTTNTTISSTGEIVEGYGATSEIFMRVDPAYKYQKNGNRLIAFAYYDANFNLLYRYSGNKWNNRQPMELPALPQDACFMRFSTHEISENWHIAITRIA